MSLPPDMTRLPMTRWKAASVHLGLSAFVTGAIALLLVYCWYPPGFFQMAQADRLLLLMGCINLALGPLLTLIVFRKGKSLRALRFDLCVIAVLQVCALAYGLQTVWKSRPVYLVASENKIDLIFANEISPAKLAKASKEYRQLPAFGPRTVSMLVPSEMNVLWAQLLRQRNEVDPSNYHPYAEIIPALKKNARPIAELLPHLPAPAQASLASAAHSTEVPDLHIAALPVHSARGDAMMLIDRRSGRPLRPVPVEWTEDTDILKPARGK